MSDGNRGSRVAVIGALAALTLTSLGTGAFFGSIYAPEKRHYQSVGANSGQTYPANSPRNGLADIAGLDPVVESLVAKPQPRDSDEREDRDLAAQETMAVFGYWVFWAMLLQTALAAGALFALLRDIRQSRQTADVQLRPWVDVEIKAISMATSKETFSLTVDFKVTNLGASPALRVMTRARIYSGGERHRKTGEFFPGPDYTRIVLNLLPHGTGEDSLHPRVDRENLAMSRMIKNGVAQEPRFYPILEVVTEYEWGSPGRKGKTVKQFAISAIPPEGWKSRDRAQWPIKLGPVVPLTTFESSIAELS